ncbi:cytochrome-c peroxidase [Dyadobacter frigoris]|uniref:Cytochrome-c peroxidase n=1 Tax=Dyadobacter frigoris TaxID=2576211 RepID=A0A4U6CWG9_9BACT|nr:cytochrome c peroxidase [Dyadobacter frigoris]TKT85694.1 cytochrome-c peroxidase [Dyadobacter frigoris]GLU55361.1 cytochrome-c peroxidase [Dyadobacter frigoris]
MNHWKATILAAILINILPACSRNENVSEPQVFHLAVPEHFPQPAADTENPATSEGVALGKELFFDTRLSADNNISCASCHLQSKAFSDGVALSSAGVSHTTLLRHTPALFNLAWADNGLFWDGGSSNLESQAFGPLTAHDEMGQDLLQLVAELNAVPLYVKRFKTVFNEEIKPQNIVKALAQFERSLISANSKYDNYKLGKSGATLSPLELKGMELVRSKCQGCHAGELFTDFSYHNNGIDSDFTNTDHEGIYQGRYRISYDVSDLGSFKTPSLRNLALTAPYMHDGRFATLQVVIDHYSENIRYSQTLDPLLTQKGMKLSKEEKEAILAFLSTLTDYTFTGNPVFSKP